MRDQGCRAAPDAGFGIQPGGGRRRDRAATCDEAPLDSAMLRACSSCRVIDIGIMLLFRWIHDPERAGERDDHEHQREDQRQHVPAAFGLGVHVQEVDHVDHDLHRAEPQDDQRPWSWSCRTPRPSPARTEWRSG